MKPSHSGKYVTLRSLLYALLALFILPVLAHAAEENPGGIKGKVTTSDDKPAAGVSIKIKETSKGVMTDEEGVFELRRVQPGSYTIQVSLVGFETIEQRVEVAAGKTTATTIRLTISDRQLQEVVITAGKNKFARKESNNVARLPLKNLENPQVYTVVPKELMQEQIVTDYKSIFKNVPGVVATVPTNGGTYMSMRGFYTGSYLRNGLAAQQYVGLDPINVERVEAIKGPSGTLFGSSLITFGGLTNRITKRPMDAFKGEIDFSTGSWGLGRLTADINTPVNQDKSALLRVNAAASYQHSFQDYGFDRSFALAPSFSYQVNDRLSLLLDAEHYTVSRSVPLYPFITGVTAKSFRDLKLGYNRSLTTDENMVKQGSDNVFVQAQYKLPGKWVSTTQYAYSQGQWDQLSSLWAYWLNDTTIRRALTLQRPRTFSSMNVQQNITGEFYLGSFRNRIVAGIDAYYSNTQYQTYGTISYDTINIYAPVKAISLAKMNGLAEAISPTSGNTSQYQYAAYVSDVINITGQLIAMASLRVDRFDAKGTSINSAAATGLYKQTSLSPKFGLVYQVVPDQVSLFANYMNGFQNVAPVVQPDGSTSTFKPQQGNQWEGGVKLDVFSHKLSATFSYYNIDVSNSTRTENKLINNIAYAFTVQNGTQRSRGFEAEVISSPLPGLNIVAGYGYNDNRYIKASASAQGKKATAASPHIANLWVSYKWMNGAAKGLGAGFGGNYKSDSYWDVANTFVVPSLLTVDATVFYDIASWRLGIKLNNIGSARGWDMNAVAQSPRQLIASVAYKF